MSTEIVDGREVSVVARESEFTSEDVDLLLAYDRHRSELGSHGFPMSEATSSLADPNNPEGEYKYVGASAPIVDYVKKASHDAEEAYRKAYEGVDMSALIFPVHREDR